MHTGTRPLPHRAARARCAPRILALALIAATVTGCASTRGVAEFAAYQQAYTSAAESGQAILDRLAVAERRVFDSSQAPLTANNVPFVVDHARYYVDAVDPPATGSFRNTIEVVRLYNDAVTGLANGEATEAMTAQLSLIGNSAIGTGTQIAGLAGVGAGELAGLATRLVDPMKALAPLAKYSLEQRTREEFRRRLLGDHVHVDAVLAGLIDATPRMYAVLTRPLVRGAKSVGGTRELTAAEKAELLQLRTALGSWVILLQGSRSALAAAVDAARRESGAGAIATFVATSGELRAAASQVRRNLAAVGTR